MNLVEFVIGTVSNILISSGRSIGGIVPDVTVEEVGRDTTFVTNHPVETGAAISDHAFMMPVEVEMKVGWSDSTAGFQGYSAIIYQALQGLQKARQPFVVVTGKRLYTNMLIVALEVTTTEQSEYSLMVRVGLREVIIASTSTTSAGTPASPQSTGGTTESGTKQATPLPGGAPIGQGGIGHA